jgi:hypothetical protein
VSVFVAKDPATFVTQALSGKDGSFALDLPVGGYDLIASGRGNGEHIAIPGRPRLLAEGYLPGKSQAITVSADHDLDLTLTLSPSAEFSLQVDDGHGGSRRTDAGVSPNQAALLS